MKFKAAPTDENFPLLRMVSENGIWELGFTPVLFGVRVRLGKVGDMGVCLDYCAGASEGMRQKLLIFVLMILLPEDEKTLTCQQVSAMFPPYTIRPMENDTVCLSKLEKMSIDAMKRANE